jgi:hypothetical protein
MQGVAYWHGAGSSNPLRSSGEVCKLSVPEKATARRSTATGDRGPPQRDACAIGHEKRGASLQQHISVCSINIGERTVIVVRETDAFDPVHRNIQGSAGLARSFKVVWSKPVPQHEDAGQSGIASTNSPSRPPGEGLRTIGSTRLSFAHLVDWRTTVVSLIARTRLSEHRGLALVVGICRRAKRRTRVGGCCQGADRRGPLISPMKLRTPLKLFEHNFKPAR